MEAAKGTELEPLSGAEWAEALRLRKCVAEQEKDIAFLGKASAYFAANPPKRSARTLKFHEWLVCWMFLEQVFTAGGYLRIAVNLVVRV